MLRAAGHNPTKAINLLWKDILANAKHQSIGPKEVSFVITTSNLTNTLISVLSKTDE